ncbi:MAG: MarR family transcriptional regulator for hemolysin [Oleiphilaceae bacterium]|jgi:MarR family transcriptional regulator for hemolysin
MYMHAIVFAIISILIGKYQVMSDLPIMPDDFDPCLSLNLRKANRVMSQIYDHYLAEHGIKSTQFAILRAATFLGQTNNKQLQEVLILDQTTLSRNLKPLLRDGFISAQEGDDRRIKVLSLTKDGQALFERAKIQWQQAQTEVKKKLGEKNTALLHSLSNSIVSLKG